MAWEDFANKSTSEKIVLAWVHSSARPIEWALDVGAVYRRVDEFVINANVDGADYNEGTNSSLSSGMWWYDPTTRTIYLRMSDDSNPSLNNLLRLDYRFFFANSPINLPYDLSSGEVVHYEGRLFSLPVAKQQIEASDLIGIAVESSGNISFHNTDGYFDDKFDRYFWENKEVKTFSYSESGIRNLFKGLIQNKSFTRNLVNFQLKDFLYKLRDNSFSSIYTTADGSLNNDIIGRYKRVIYGKTTGLRIQSIDQVVDGVVGAGTITGTFGTTSIIGTSTSFLTQLSKNDIVEIDLSGFKIEFTVDDIINNTQFLITEEIEQSFAGESFLIKTERASTSTNREYLVSGDKLSQPSTTVSAVVSLNRITVNNITDFFVSDRVQIGSEFGVIKSITSSTIVLIQNLNSFPSIGTTVTRSPIVNVYFQGKIIGQNKWSLVNTTDCKMTFTSDAEQSIAQVKSLPGSVTFSASSRTVTIASGNFEKLRPRDLIRSDDINHKTFYEILQIEDETTLKLRSNYGGTNYLGNSFYKSVEYFKDNSIVTIDCYGKENEVGEWISDGPMVVRDIVRSVGITDIDEATFTEAASDMPYTIDLKLPLSMSEDMPVARDIIGLINKSIFGNLVTDQNFDLVYKAWDGQVDPDVITLQDHDILDYSVKSNTNIIKTAVVRYRQFDADRYTGAIGTSAEQLTSSFVNQFIGSAQTKDINVYLYSSDDAREIAERLLLLFSLTQSEINIKSSLSLSKFEINDKIIVDFRRMYSRFGSISDGKKLYIVNSITRDGASTDLGCSDMGNTLSRTARITDNSALDYSSATSENILINSYIVEDGTELPSLDELAWGDNIIG